MTTKKLLATGAAAALAFPAAAAADKPEASGSHGKANAAEQKAKQKKQKKQKGKAFTLKGVEATGLTVTGGKLAGPVTLDPTSANKFARTFLDLTKSELKGEETVTLGTAGDAVRITYVGLSSTDALQPTDTVKVIGRLSGTTLDIRKIVVTRGDTDDEQQQD